MASTHLKVKNPGGHAMLLDKDIEVPTRDGSTLRANVFRPAEPGRYPVIMTLGPYGKDVHMKEFQPAPWANLVKGYPSILEASSCEYLGFETPDPERWVPDGYVILKIDSRGAGKTPGYLDVNSPREYQDFYDAIEWAGTQGWSNGNVGLLGISYYAASQWNVAALKPPHLKAILPWQGTPDFYNGRTRQGGILASGFVRGWFGRSVLGDQYGNPESPFHDLFTGELNTGPEKFTPEQLRANREDYYGNLLKHPMLDDWYKARNAKYENITVPALVVANWGGLGLHLWGTIAGYMNIASKEKWLKVMTDSYFISFIVPEHVAIQKRFFDHYLKGLDNGWEKEPKVEVRVRAPHDGVHRTVNDSSWPLTSTKPTKLWLDASNKGLSKSQPSSGASVSYQGMGEGHAFSIIATEDMEFAGPSVAHLWLSTTSTDIDVFAVLRAYDDKGKELNFVQILNPNAPVTMGWMRVSHRTKDEKRSTDLMPYYPHEVAKPLKPGEVVDVQVQLWPGSLFLPKGYRLELSIAGKDFKEAGNWNHDDPEDRPADRFGGTVTLHTGGTQASYLLLPMIR
jgi:predicted acyl esterase